MPGITLQAVLWVNCKIKMEIGSIVFWRGPYTVQMPVTGDENRERLLSWSEFAAHINDHAQCEHVPSYIHDRLWMIWSLTWLYCCKCWLTVTSVVGHCLEHSLLRPVVVCVTHLVSYYDWWRHQVHCLLAWFDVSDVDQWVVGCNAVRRCVIVIHWVYSGGAVCTRTLAPRGSRWRMLRKVLKSGCCQKCRGRFVFLLLSPWHSCTI